LLCRNATGNRLTGTLGTFIGLLSLLTFLDVRINVLVGSLPDVFAKLPSLRSL